MITSVVALALTAGLGLVGSSLDEDARSQATIETVGRISDGFRPPADETVVVWRDKGKIEESTPVVLDEPEKWRAGQEVRLRYDLDEGRDPSATAGTRKSERNTVIMLEPGIRHAGEDTAWDFWWPAAVIGSAFALALLAWTARWLLNRSAAAADPIPMRVLVVRSRGNVQRVDNGTVAHLLLAPADSPFDPARLERVVPRILPGTRWQRVHWDTTMEHIAPGQVLAVRERTGFGRRAVVEHPSGHRFQPAGGLRDQGPRGMVHTVQFLRPYPRAIEHVRMPLIIWLLPFVVGGSVGTNTGFVFGSVLFVAGTSIAVSFAWAWTGPAPNDV
ncbi:hypothetical protein, partial [Umezawaea sp. NPDC059074]|uniref:hypothetical protein n=1 Tax=Umezawaea sp. NPDC059074 TaxID=3346716 RepID=UPI0036CB6149